MMRTLAGLWLWAMLLGAPAQAQGLYAIDQRYGAIEFTVDHLGLFTSRGGFRSFAARLMMDPGRPEQTRIDVNIDAGSVDMSWREALEMLRSPDYFDIRDHPRISFTSTAVVPVAPDRYRIQGLLMLRGVTRPQTLEATLVDRHADPGGGGDVANFVVKGTLDRTAFGMTANRDFVSDMVDLLIRVRLALGHAAHAG